jgi:hypothetical protein
MNSKTATAESLAAPLGISFVLASAGGREMHSRGAISEDVLRRLERDLDLSELRADA